MYYNETDPHEPVSKVDYDALSNAPITEQEPTAREQAATSVKGSNEPGTSSMPAVEAVHEDAQSRQLMAGIGTSSRKRSAKVVGGDAHADEVQKPNQKSETARKQGPKKAKRPKLSFQGD